ncbi:MAG: hypothetical protein WBB99_18710 [Rhodococcus sp. (in: high G+C Gram-positive bacteria)]
MPLVQTMTERGIQRVILTMLAEPTNPGDDTIALTEIAAEVRKVYPDASMTEIIRAVAVLIDRLRVLPVLIEPIPVFYPDEEF